MDNTNDMNLNKNLGNTNNLFFKKNPASVEENFREFNDRPMLNEDAPPTYFMYKHLDEQVKKTVDYGYCDCIFRIIGEDKDNYFMETTHEGHNYTETVSKGQFTDEFISVRGVLENSAFIGRECWRTKPLIEENGEEDHTFYEPDSEAKRQLAEIENPIQARSLSLSEKNHKDIALYCNENGMVIYRLFLSGSSISLTDKNKLLVVPYKYINEDWEFSERKESAFLDSDFEVEDVLRKLYEQTFNPIRENSPIRR